MSSQMNTQQPVSANDEKSRLYWRLVVGCIVGSLLWDVLTPRMHPTSFWAEGVYKLGFIVPLVVSWGAGVLAGPSISLRARCWSGFIQSQAVVCLVFAEFLFDSYRSVLGIRGEDPLEIIAAFLAAIGVVYTVLHASVTHLGAKWLASRRHDDLACRHCGYCLRGLRDPRCPECGTPLDPTLLTLPGDGPERTTS
jgi:hypothetical protein